MASPPATARLGITPSAITANRPPHRLGQLWQLPLLLVSLGLFSYSAWLFIDPKPGLSIDQKIDLGKLYLRNERPEAALDHLNRLLITDKLDPSHEGLIHLLLAQSVEAAQIQQHMNLPTNHGQIIEQSRLALAMGVKNTADIQRRLGESYEAIDKPTEALEHYRQAMALDESRSLRLQRKVIELQLAQNESGPAQASIESYLKSAELTDAERAAAMCKLARLWVDQCEYVKARALLSSAMQLDAEPVTQGQGNYFLGYCAWKLGDNAEAERLLRVSRQQMGVAHPLDADAAWLLGKLLQDKSDHAVAESFYRDVLVSHPESRVAPLALLGRGECRLRRGEDEAGLSDLHDVTMQVSSSESKAVHKPEVIAALSRSAGHLSSKGNYQGALELLAYQQQLQPEPPPRFFDQLADVYEQRADQLEKSAEIANAADRIRKTRQVREFRSKAGDSYIAYSRALTLKDDKGYGEALWKGIDLYDRSSNVQSAISAMELFVTERPDDSLAPAALLRLGRAYQAAGLLDKAIAAFQRNQFRYPNSLAASKSAIPLAQAYVAKGPQAYTKAESVLKSVVENNPLLTPEAEEFKQALFELAQLYYRTGRFEEAVARLEELTARYPGDDRMGQLLFLMGDSYRKSAGLLDSRLVSASADARSAAVDAAEANAARKDRLGKARTLYDRTIELYRSTPPKTETDKLYNRLSHFYRADCLYDLGQYEEAIRLYDAAAFRYQDDASALAAYVQIVNAYCALGKNDEAKTANERAKWLLKRMPPEAFTDGSFAMPKAYWEQWLRWTSQSGMW